MATNQTTDTLFSKPKQLEMWDAVDKEWGEKENREAFLFHWGWKGMEPRQAVNYNYALSFKDANEIAHLPYITFVDGKTIEKTITGEETNQLEKEYFERCKKEEAERRQESIDRLSKEERMDGIEYTQ